MAYQLTGNWSVYQQFMPDNKENTKGLRYCPLRGESTIDQQIPLTKAQ